MASLFTSLYFSVHGETVYQELIRVPLVIRLPDVAGALRAVLDAHEAANAQHPLAKVRETANIEDRRTLHDLKGLGYLR